MAFESYRRSVTTTATLLYSHPSTGGHDTDEGAKRLVIINVSATQAEVSLGPSGVTASTGARWTVEAGRSLSVQCEPGEALYAIVASGTQSIDVLVEGR